MVVVKRRQILQTLQLVIVISQSDLALPHYDTRDVSAITDLPYMVVSRDLGQCAIALSQLENAQ